MRVSGWLVPRNLGLRPPSRTIRLRLTVLYASLFLASGVGLLSVTYVLVRHATGNVLVGTSKSGGSFMISGGKAPGVSGGSAPATAVGTFQGQVSASGVSASALPPLSKKAVLAQITHDRALAERQHTAELHQLLEQSGIALVLMAALSIGIGWFAAGRVLRPLRTINDRARQISASSLHRRLALAGPDDELSQLANTFDELLGRLEGSFAAQRQFVANASHELRTPLARARTVAEVALDDPEATVESLRASHQRVLAAGEQQERLIEALLTLARSERGLDQRAPFDLASLTSDLLDARLQEAERLDISLHATLEPALASGNAALAERLVVNLVDNALRYNVPRGRVEVTTSTSPSGQAVLTVANSGPQIDVDDLARLSRPFQRLGADRTDRSDGVGLGLSIVAAVAAAHDAALDVQARPEGGLLIAVAFPAPASAGEPIAGAEAECAGAPARRIGRRPRPTAERELAQAVRLQ
jgi:signal transduction histidine kinase